MEVGRSIARNNLVKTALFGADPNWGRILAAVGTTSARFEPDELAVAVNGVWVCRNGAAGEDRSKVDLSGRAVTLVVDLGAGRRRRPSGRTTCRWPTCTRTRRTRRDRTTPRAGPRDRAGQGEHAHRGAAVAGAVPRHRGRHQVRRARDGRPRGAARLRGRPGVPALRRAAARSSCTAAGRRSRPCWTGSASPASSGAGCG